MSLVLAEAKLTLLVGDQVIRASADCGVQVWRIEPRFNQ